MNTAFKTVAFAAIAVALMFAGRTYNARLDEQAASEANYAELKAHEEQAQKIASLQISDVKTGSGAEAKSGSTVSVHYIGTFTDGTVFDSSYERNQPFEFVLGEGAVIEGWELALLGMKVGGKRSFTVPSELGYGAEGKDPIPPNTTLKFTAELLSVK